MHPCSYCSGRTTNSWTWTSAVIEPWVAQVRVPQLHHWVTAATSCDFSLMSAEAYNKDNNQWCTFQSAIKLRHLMQCISTVNLARQLTICANKNKSVPGAGACYCTLQNHRFSSLPIPELFKRSTWNVSERLTNMGRYGRITFETPMFPVKQVYLRS